MIRKMTRFSLRDMFWVTLVAASWLCWWLDSTRLRTELRQAEGWRTRAGALEQVLKNEHWSVYLNVTSSEIIVTHKPVGGFIGLSRQYVVSANSIEPTLGTESP
jgi:hypothetical protein